MCKTLVLRMARVFMFHSQTMFRLSVGETDRFRTHPHMYQVSYVTQTRFDLRGGLSQNKVRLKTSGLKSVKTTFFKNVNINAVYSKHLTGDI